MSTAYRRLRRQMPYLTPSWAGEDAPRDLLDRFKLPRVPIPVDDDDGLRIPPLDPERLSTSADIVRSIPMLAPRPFNPVPFDESAPPPPIAGLTRLPTRIGDEQLAEIGAPPMVINRNGRPTDQFIGEGTPEDRLLTRRRALESYQPQKESIKKLLLRSGLNILRGGLIGEGGVADTLLGQGGVFDRRGVDRAWQQQQLGQVNQQYGMMKADRRAALQDDLLESQVRENQAQAARALREPQAPPVKPPPPARRIPPVKQVDEAGNEYLADAETGEPLLDTKGNLRYTGRAKAPTVKPDTAEFTNEQIGRTIAEIEAEQRTLGPSPPTEIADVNQFGEVIGKKLNPAYTDWARRYRELDDQKRQLRLKQKPTTKAPAVVTRSSGGVTEQTIRDAAKAKNLDPEQAVKRARARGMIR